MMTDTLKNHSLKIQVGTIVGVVIFLVTTTTYFVDRFSKLEAEDAAIVKTSERLHEQDKIRNSQIAVLQEKLNHCDMDLIKILTKLENIEVTLMELKQELKSY